MKLYIHVGAALNAKYAFMYSSVSDILSIIRIEIIGGGTGGPRGGGARAPQLSAYRGLAALGPQLCDCDLVLHWCNSKIKQLQHIHKPHVTFYMHRLYLMAAPSLMFHFLESFRRSLLLEAKFLA